jgi:hypothetical protein
MACFTGSASTTREVFIADESPCWPSIVTFQPFPARASPDTALPYAIVPPSPLICSASVLTSWFIPPLIPETALPAGAAARISRTASVSDPALSKISQNLG